MAAIWFVYEELWFYQQILICEPVRTANFALFKGTEKWSQKNSNLFKVRSNWQVRRIWRNHVFFAWNLDCILGKLTFHSNIDLTNLYTHETFSITLKIFRFEHFTGKLFPVRRLISRIFSQKLCPSDFTWIQVQRI